MDLKKYFDFAENDYQYLINSYQAGFVANMMGAMAQGICEKYFKQIINEYPPVNETERIKKQDVMHTHSLNRLVKYLEKDMKIGLSGETKALMKQIDGYYFSTRYPGDDSIELDEEDIAECVEAVQKCREEVVRIIEDKKRKEDL